VDEHPSEFSAVLSKARDRAYGVGARHGFEDVGAD
jgi:hypothetical protein